MTARSRQNDGNRATGTLQFVTEMAAPPRNENTSRHLRPKAANRVRMEAWRQWRDEVDEQKQIQGEHVREKRWIWGCGGALRAHEALPHTPPGGKPPETPSPLSLRFEVPEQRESVKDSQAAQNRRVLDRSPLF